MAKRIYPDRYLEAAHERLQEARILRKSGRYGPSVYLAGVAAECILRAYRTREKRQFHERHDLAALLEGCNQRLFGTRRRQLHSAITTLTKIWQNDFRYHSRQLLLTRFRKRKMTRTFEGRRIDGDPLKFYCGVAIEQATKLVEIGDEKWIS